MFQSCVLSVSSRDLQLLPARPARATLRRSSHKQAGMYRREQMDCVSSVSTRLGMSLCVLPPRQLPLLMLETAAKADFSYIGTWIQYLLRRPLALLRRLLDIYCLRLDVSVPHMRHGPQSLLTTSYLGLFSYSRGSMWVARRKSRSPLAEAQRSSKRFTLRRRLRTKLSKG